MKYRFNISNWFRREKFTDLINPFVLIQMEYPVCPDNYTLEWNEVSLNTFYLQCRPSTDMEIEIANYIKRLIATLYVVPALAIMLLCISCICSRNRFYRSRKNSSESPSDINQV